MGKFKNIYWIKHTKKNRSKKISEKLWKSPVEINGQCYTCKKKGKFEK